MSDHVLITNPDTRVLAEDAGIRNYSFCPHPIDETIFCPGDEADWRQHLRKEHGAEVLLFAPARQNWALKGNDRMFRAFAELMKSGMSAVLLVPGWGQEVAQSKALCRQLGISDRVAWLAPMPERLLARYYRAADVILDQFQLGVFGLITPKAMACGAIVLTSYEDRHNSWCFPTPPPVVPCSSADQIARAVTNLMADANARLKIRAASQAWIAQHHSSRVVAERLSQAMESARRHFENRMRDGY